MPTSSSNGADCVAGMDHADIAPHRLVLAALALVVVVAAAACSAGGHSPPVAALPTSTAGRAGATSPATATPSVPSTAVTARPREQLDESPSQIQALLEPYNQCVAAHGGKGTSGSTSPAAEAAAEAACINFDPLPPWQYDPANPKAMGFVQQVVACLHQHGVHFAQVTDPPGQDRIEIALGGPQNDQTSISKGMDLIPTCNQQVLQAGAGR